MLGTGRRMSEKAEGRGIEGKAKRGKNKSGKKNIDKTEKSKDGEKGEEQG